MKIKVHWIVDGIAELDADSQEEAEKWVNEALTNILNIIHLFLSFFWKFFKFFINTTLIQVSCLYLMNIH